MVIKRFADRARDFLSVETLAERRIWDGRIELLRNTVGVDYSDEKFQRQLAEEIELLKARYASEHPPSHDTLTICAEERLRVRALCAARCALPAFGVDISELQDMGFDTGRPGEERNFGILRVVGFPEGWQMEPISEAPRTLNTSFAVVTDGVGSPQLDVFYSHSVAGDRLTGYTLRPLAEPQV